MEVKVYVSGISASNEVKKRQQRVILLLDSAQVNYEQIDITEPGREEERQEVQTMWKVRKEKGAPLPPQFFLGETYLGDYEDFNSAVDVDDLLTFLRLENKRIENNNVTIPEIKSELGHIETENIVNGKSVESPHVEDEEKEVIDDHHEDSTTIEEVAVEEDIHIDEEEEREIDTENEEVEEIIETETVTRTEVEKEEASDEEEAEEDDEEEN